MANGAGRFAGGGHGGVDDQVGVGIRGDLGQVGDDDDLVGARQSGQSTPDLHRRPPAHAGVDLVEHHGGALGGGGQHHLQCQHHPGQFATGCAFVQRQHRVGVGGAAVRGEAELNRIHPVGAGVRQFPGRQCQRRAVAISRRHGGDRDGEVGIGHRQTGQFRGDGLGQSGGGFPALLGQLHRAGPHLSLEFAHPVGQPGQRLLGNIECGQALPRLFGPAQYAVDIGGVLADQGAQFALAGELVLQRAGVGGQRGQEVTEFAADIADDRQRLGELNTQCSQRGVFGRFQQRDRSNETRCGRTGLAVDGLLVDP